MKILMIFGVLLILISNLLVCHAYRHYTFEVKEASYTRLCSTKKILTVNGGFPGPTLYASKGETIIVDVYNKANENITIHWHGVNQPRYPWSDGPDYITQCPIRPGHKFSQKIIFSEEEGTLWWHAHSDYNRATVHGAIVVKPKPGTTYPFPKPHGEFPIVLGEWWKQDIDKVFNDFVKNGGGPVPSDAYTINGQPGDLYNCSKHGTSRFEVRHGKTYLLRVINAALENLLYFGIANHKLTVVGSDASYLKPFKTNYIILGPGQTIDVLLKADQPLGQYYMASKVYTLDDPKIVSLDPTTTTAILQYKAHHHHHIQKSSSPSFPSLPSINNSKAFTNFIGKLKSLVDKNHPIHLPLEISTKLYYVVSMNTLPCNNKDGSPCVGPNGNRVAASVNNISFELPNISILDAYSENIKGVFGRKLPNKPRLVYDFTSNNLPPFLLPSKVGTEVKVLEYGSTVELVLQGTNLLSGADHPIHLHGHSFYVVGWGFGNFDKEKDPLKYNLVDPPYKNTIVVPKNGWVAIRFTANNPGVWFMHCHLERHVTWGMAMTWITKNGKNPDEQMLPPPHDYPKC